MFWLSAKFETYTKYTLMINHIGYIDIFIKLCWFDLAKGEAGRQRPWASCLFPLWSLLMFNFSDFVKISKFLLVSKFCQVTCIDCHIQQYSFTESVA